MATPSLKALLCLSTLASATGLHVFLSGARPIRARIAVCASRTLPIRACSSIGPEQRNALRQAFHAPDAEFDENDPNNRVIKPKRQVDDDTDTDGAAATGGVRANTLNHAPSDAEKPSSMPNSPGLTQPPVPAEAPGADALPWVLRDLPLLRVPWVALPGFRQMYHVHEAHYCQMFEELVNTHGGPTTAANGRFGHLLLAGGSASLGTEAAQLEPEGSVAPIIGALMEVRNLDRLDDGRLVVVAHAVGRFRVLNETRSEPFSAANVVILPDEEESTAHVPAVMSLREKAGLNLPPAGSEASGGAGGGGERGMRKRWGGLLGGGGKDAAVGWFALESAWTLAAARAAAATASLYWASVEFAGAAGPEPSIDLPTVSSRINARVVGLNAEAAAMEAAHSVCELPPMEALPPHVSALKGLHSWQSVSAGGRSDAADARPPPSSVPSSIPLIGIEQSVWYHLLTWLSLVRRARGLPDAPQPVPSALRQLSPPAPGGKWPEGAAADLPVQPPLGAYPAIRRAQKMSYIVTAMLPGLSEEDRHELLRAPSVRRRLVRILEHLLLAIELIQPAGNVDGEKKKKK